MGMGMDTGTNAAATAVKRSAEISQCGSYRYELRRDWKGGNPLGFIMLNPSTADGLLDDPTIRRCVGFANAFGFGGIIVWNLYGYRATNPSQLRIAADPVGPKNDWHLSFAASMVATVCAWGTSGGKAAVERGRSVARQLASRGAHLYHLGLTRDGVPRHPLYLPGDAPLVRWEAGEC